jgi:hypothetical protein
MDGRPDIASYRGVAELNHQPHWIAVNTWLLDRKDEQFMALLKNCQGIQELRIYLVGECR